MKRLKQKLRKAKRSIDKKVTYELAGQGVIGGVADFMGAYNAMAEVNARIVEAYKRVFIQEGLDSTKNYLQKRILHFGTKYRAAQKALQELE